MKRGMITLGLGSVITLTTILVGASWAIAMAISNTKVDIATTKQNIESHETQDSQQFASVTKTLDSLNNKVDALLINQGINPNKINQNSSQKISSQIISQ